MAKMYGLFALVIFVFTFFAILYGFVEYSSQNKQLRMENNDLKGQVSQMIKVNEEIARSKEMLESEIKTQGNTPTEETVILGQDNTTE